jgi:glycosyltransferase involved in cell wall biosynthesis
MSKNVLFIGPTRQSCGWGIASRLYVQALVKAGCNVTVRPIYMSNSILSIIDPFFIELENIKYDHYDVVIQNVLPHLLDYNSDFGKNVALFYSETSGWENTWPRKLNMMDEIWVPSIADKWNTINSKVRKLIKVIPIPIDLNKFTKNYPKGDGIDPNDFNFYFIGEFVERKNLDTLIKAFHLEFDIREPVNLVIKTHSNGNKNQFEEMLDQYINKIKSSLRIYNDISKYKQDIVITEFLPDESLYSLHSSCHCLVMPSSGESWSLPVIDAMGFGNIPLVTKGIGPYYSIPDRYKDQCSIDSTEESVIVQNPPLQDLYTGSEYYYKPNISSLRNKMRLIFENRNGLLNRDMSEAMIDQAEQFSIDSVAEMIKGVI